MTTDEQHEQHQQHGDQAQHAPQEDREDRLTEQVVESFRGASSERYRQVMQSLVRHAHAFVREVRLTEDEWQQAVSFLPRCGHITDDKRQELILLSDVLGLSMLTIAVNQPPEPEVTEATVVGPFFVEGAPRVSFGEDIARGATGEPCWFEGTVRGSDGAPVPNAR